MHMNTERTHAYGRVVKTLDELGPTKLQPAEQQRVREAADTLIFASEFDEARAAMTDMDSLAEHLVASDRWSEERAKAARRRPARLRAGHRRRLVGDRSPALRASHSGSSESIGRFPSSCVSRRSKASA